MTYLINDELFEKAQIQSFQQMELNENKLANRKNLNYVTVQVRKELNKLNHERSNYL